VALIREVDPLRDGRDQAQVQADQFVTGVDVRFFGFHRPLVSPDQLQLPRLAFRRRYGHLFPLPSWYKPVDIAVKNPETDTVSRRFSLYFLGLGS
jgi:hypothetical protein